MIIEGITTSGQINNFPYQGIKLSKPKSTSNIIIKAPNAAPRNNP